MKLLKHLLCLITLSFVLTACNSGGDSTNGANQDVSGISTPSTVSVVN